MSAQTESVDPEIAEAASGTLERYLGNAIRDLRQRHGLTIAEVADRAGISRGMLSKIENAQTATSLDGLNRLAQALGVSLSTLFRNYDVPEGSAQLVKKGEGMEVVRRGTRRGHTYHLLAHEQGPTKLFEPFLITIDSPDATFPVFEHPGTEFLYMLEGRMEYRHGQNTYLMTPGDALSFRGEVPHGPEKLIELPIRFLATLVYPGPVES
ncbi:MAG: XRE family transcriptional regulator [Hydrogenophilales bacterium 16-64-46]|jgi:transcriptional regulator with XRE-family HTH domain|nr:MAG: XRE family transcriptional regulator [Hydrogenophilales bacterium 12-64-13]OYZ05837.1 MAG: XRE family transcriptional regulator [Hydrogenophilales bacterium 16-64-46]OZA39772.1 MAG: XRE family transcriptional regulator [Hydrogenophilales bacterium 17-64-34]HQS98686.1 XRE family transcriptional regulator [Thiobacillus sp.]